MVTIDNNKCIGCGLCITDCVFNSLKLTDRKAVQDGRCILCGHCVAICPDRVVSIPEYDMGDIEEFNKDGFSLDAATLLKVIKFRRSIRSFTEKKIEREKLDKVIQAGRYTETGSNAQAFSRSLARQAGNLEPPLLEKGRKVDGLGQKPPAPGNVHGHLHAPSGRGYKRVGISPRAAQHVGPSFFDGCGVRVNMHAAIIQPGVNT